MDTLEKKAQRFRSVAYPSYTIRESTELVRRINQQFGYSNFNTREDISQELEMSVGNLMMKLSTATQYELLEMKSKEGYKPTQRFTSIYKPLSEDEKRRSEIECLLSPELYGKLIEHYKGKQLPAPGGLAILLYRSFKVSEDASVKAAKVFLENLADLGLIDADNHLKENFFGDNENEYHEPEELTQEITVLNEPINKQIAYKPTTHFAIEDTVTNSAPPIPIFLKGKDRLAKVLMPIDFDNTDIDQIIRVLEVYKRP